METKKQNYTLPIIVMIFLFGMISFVTNLASPMGDILKYQFNVPNWMGTLGVFANFIAYAIMGYPAGNMLQKYGYKKTALIAIAVGFTGVGIQTLSGSVESFGVYLLGAFIAGFSMCLLNTVVNPMLNKLGGGGNKGNQLIQAGGSFNSLCGTAVIILTGLLIPEGIKNAQISNVFPLMYGALAIFAFAFIVIALTKIPETQKTEGKKVAETSKYSPLSFRHFILGSVAIFVYVGVEVGVPNVLQKWLQNPELNVLGSGVNVEAIAGSVAATYWLLMLVGRLLGAMIGSKVSAKSMLMVVSSAGLLLTLGAMFAPNVPVNLPVFNGAEGFGLVNVPVSAALLVLVGLCTSIMWGGIFNLAVEGLGKYTEKASGIFMALVCGGGILPLLQNGIVDLTGGVGYLTSYWVIVAGLAYMLYFGAIVLLPQLLQEVYGYTATWAGLASAPVGVIPVILSPIIGRFAHKLDMRRLVTFSFIMYAVCFYWRAWTFEPGMDFGASAWPQFIQGFAVACFFMPLTTITLSGLPPERLAAASSLSNFTRTLAGSIGTSITTTLWTNREALHHAQLTESVTPFNPNAQQIYDQLQGMGMTQQQASGWIAQQITNQGLIISANEIFWISAAIFILLLGLVWFARPPFSAGGGGGGAH